MNDGGCWMMEFPLPLWEGGVVVLEVCIYMYVYVNVYACI